MDFENERMKMTIFQVYRGGRTNIPLSTLLFFSYLRTFEDICIFIRKVIYHQYFRIDCLISTNFTNYPITNYLIFTFISQKYSLDDAISGDRTLSKIKIVTDSTSDLPKDLAKKYDIEIIPLNIFFGDKQFKDRVDLTPGEFYEMCNSGDYEWPKTSQPSAKEFMELYTQILDQGYETIISVHITPKMSGTLNSVQLAIKNMPDADIVPIDSNNVTLGLGLLAYMAGKLNKEGKSREEIITTLKKQYIPNTRICAVIDTLEYLHRGGRIGRAKKIVGTLLNKKPFLEVKDGQVSSIDSVKGHDEGFDRMVKMAPHLFDTLLVDELWIGYADTKEYSEKLYEAIKDIPNAPNTIRQVEIGPTVGAHLGPGVMTYCWLGDWQVKWFKE
ncbi:MAG: DegV family EDD domain-containing protein [Candidatus Heimdallarchaeota archaeon]|nr:DegV family EDD domain-containing protein [Candidatus Heimdallarchaeota archaeon]